MQTNRACKSAAQEETNMTYHEIYRNNWENLIKCYSLLRIVTFVALTGFKICNVETGLIAQHIPPVLLYTLEAGCIMTQKKC